MRERACLLLARPRRVHPALCHGSPQTPLQGPDPCLTLDGTAEQRGLRACSLWARRTQGERAVDWPTHAEFVLPDGTSLPFSRKAEEKGWKGVLEPYSSGGPSTQNHEEQPLHLATL